MESQINQLMKEGKFREIISWMSDLLSKDKFDQYYRWRALAISNSELNDLLQFYPALDDIEAAIDINPSEENIYTKYLILNHALDYDVHFGGTNEVIEFDYETDQIITKLEYEKSDDRVINDSSGFGVLPDPRVNSTSIIDVLDRLKEKNPKIEYLELCAKTRYDCFKQYSEEVQIYELEKACKDISKCITLEPSIVRFVLKMEIEVVLEQWDNALISIDRILELERDQPKYLHRKYWLYIRKKDFVKALDVLDEMYLLDDTANEYFYKKYAILSLENKYHEAIALIDWYIGKTQPGFVGYQKMIIEPPNPLRPEKVNAYQEKLLILLKLHDFDNYAKTLIEFFNQRLPMWLTMHLIALIKQQQYRCLLEYFTYNYYENPAIKWLSICASIKIKDMATARDLLSGFDFTALFDEETKPILYNGKNIKPRNEHQCLCDLVAIMPWDDMSNLFYVEVLDKLFYNGTRSYSLAHELINIQREIDPVILPTQESLNVDYYDDSMAKLGLIKRLSTKQKQYNKVIDTIQYTIISELTEITEQKAIERILLAQENERNRITSNLSHSIKNAIRSIIDPLIVLKKELPHKDKLLSYAIKGANLIREMVTAINASINITLDDTIWDIKNSNDESMSLVEMIQDSVTYSIGNMFDFRNYPNPAQNYFPGSITKNEYDFITSEWEKSISSLSFNSITTFANSFLFDLVVITPEVSYYRIGNTKSSAIKLLVLFQEIIFNAVKFTSYVDRSSRYIKVELNIRADKLIFSVKNNYNPKVKAKTTGVGNYIIENYAKVLGCAPIIKKDDASYSITMEFEDIWRINV